MTIWSWLAQYVLPAPPPRRVRERFLLPHEWAVIRPVLESKPQKVSTYFTFLFLTGCRRDEARTMQYVDVDFDAGLWHKRQTKNGKRHVLPLSPQACALLHALPRQGPYLFPGATPTVPWSRTAVKYWWRKIRFESGCPDVRIHDLRRSAASWLTMNGENLKVVQNMLDHSSLELTGRVYAHLDVSALRAALNRHAQRVFRTFTTTQKEVV